MSDEKQEPGELTERFQAFSRSVDPEPSKALPLALIVGIGVVVVAFVAVVWLLLA